MQDSPRTHGVHHVGLTVPDLAATRRFFIEQLGHRELGTVPDYPAVFVGDGKVMVTLWQVKDPARAVPFDRERNIGLHHLALAVESHAALDALHERLGRLADVEIEFAPEPLAGGPTRHMMLRIPGGVRLELIAK
jgi:catechol 2,3-dioxygenase-like lactoylglutathione lyase family enzyme